MRTTNLLDYKAFLRRFTYKPNFGFFHLEKDGRQWIKIMMYVEDSRKPFEPWEIQNRNEEFEYIGSQFNPFRNRIVVDSKEVMLVEGTYVLPILRPGEEEHLKHFLIGCIHKLEDHEMYEWLKLDGELIDDPHKKRPIFEKEESS